jgi:hypothetical protein
LNLPRRTARKTLLYLNTSSPSLVVLVLLFLVPARQSFSQVRAIVHAARQGDREGQEYLKGQERGAVSGSEQLTS